MKLQIQDQTLRLRVDEAELAQLLAGATLFDAIELGLGFSFRRSLALHAQATPQLQTADAYWRLYLPEAAVRDYVARLPCRKALGFELSRDGGPAVSLRFEVDVRDSLQLRGPQRRRAVAERIEA